MLSLSRKSDYGLLLLSLLTRKSRDFISISSLSKENQLPYAFFSRIASELAQAGLLNSKEGAFGGYKLAKNPKDVSIAQVVEILDGPWAPTKCTRRGKKCDYENMCPMVESWQNYLRKKLWELLNSYTLQDLTS